MFKTLLPSNSARQIKKAPPQGGAFFISALSYGAIQELRRQGVCLLETNAPGRIRTCNLRIRSATLYPVGRRAQNCFCFLRFCANHVHGFPWTVTWPSLYIGTGASALNLIEPSASTCGAGA